MKRYDLRTMYHIDLVAFITDFEKGFSGRLINRTRKIDEDAELEIKRKECYITFNFNYFKNRKHIDVGTILQKSIFKWQNSDLKIEKLFLSNATPGNMGGSSYTVSSVGFSKTRKSYFRLLIPVRESSDFNSYINRSSYKNDYGTHSALHVKAIIESNLMEAYYFDDRNGKHFFAVETNSKLTYDIFADKAFAIKNSIGYLTGKMPGNYGYFFSYNKKDMQHHKEFKFSSFRETMSSISAPINSNPYAYIRKARATADRMYKNKILRPLSFEEFSSFSERLYQSGDFTSIIMLIMECNSASLLFRPGGYAIALESISDLIMGKEKVKLAPITVPKISQDFRKELNKVVDDFSDRISPEGISALRGKIEQINQTTNKARLRAPFEKLNIKLLEADLLVLESRNDFLHGRIPDFRKLGVDRPDDIKNRDMYYASIRLYTLLSILILKWIGYDNYVTNYPKIHEGYCKIKLKESFHRKV